jgi:hypothetical protein
MRSEGKKKKKKNRRRSGTKERKKKKTKTGGPMGASNKRTGAHGWPASPLHSVLLDGGEKIYSVREFTNLAVSFYNGIS